MNGHKSVWIPAELHKQLKRECKQAFPRVNLQDRVVELIRKGLRLESLGAGISLPRD